mgnify:CR=1 FL=1
MVPLFTKKGGTGKKEVFIEFIRGLRQNTSENLRGLVGNVLLGLVVGLLLSLIFYDVLIFQEFNSLFLFPISIIFGLIFVAYFYYKRNEKKSEKLLLLFLLIVWLTLQIFLIVNIEYQYHHVLEDYKQDYADAIDTGNYNALSASWLLTERYYDEMNNTYGQNGVSLPNRLLFSNPTTSMLTICNPLLFSYFIDPNSCSKLIFLQKKGNCGEFAGATVLMVRDLSGLNTRIIHMEGADHAFPEVYFEGDWWIFDKTYTTSVSPIQERNYATHLSDKFHDLYLSIADLRVVGGGESTLEEHGFSASNVAISVLFDTIRGAEPDTPIANAEVKVYALKYLRDPLIFTGKTDANGKCNLVLHGDKEYIFLGSNDMYKGFTVVKVSPSTDESITLLLY